MGAREKLSRSGLNRSSVLCIETLLFSDIVGSNGFEASPLVRFLQRKFQSITVGAGFDACEVNFHRLVRLRPPDRFRAA